MTKKIFSIGVLITLLTLSIIAYAFPGYIGYSGAPGSQGTCASTCHGSSGGTMQVTGFPSEYTPGNSYIITVSHNGGSTITNFNGSCRIGSGQQNAGVISAGTNTVVYNVGSETNGIHFSTNYHSSGTFNWTAPSIGTGFVKLYIAGQQGSKSGPNTALVLTSNENTTSVHGINGNTPTKLTLSQNYPNPFNPETIIEYSVPQEGHLKLEIFDITGQKIETLFDGFQETGYYTIAWNASEYSSGVYLYRLTLEDRIITKRMTLLK